MISNATIHSHYQWEMKAQRNNSLMQHLSKGTVNHVEMEI